LIRKFCLIHLKSNYLGRRQSIFSWIYFGN
jgi:hypothetical protein